MQKKCKKSIKKEVRKDENGSKLLGTGKSSSYPSKGQCYGADGSKISISIILGHIKVNKVSLVLLVVQTLPCAMPCSRPFLDAHVKLQYFGCGDGVCIASRGLFICAGTALFFSAPFLQPVSLKASWGESYSCQR